MARCTAAGGCLWAAAEACCTRERRRAGRTRGVGQRAGCIRRGVSGRPVLSAWVGGRAVPGAWVSGWPVPGGASGRRPLSISGIALSGSPVRGLSVTGIGAGGRVVGRGRGPRNRRPWACQPESAAPAPGGAHGGAGGGTEGRPSTVVGWSSGSPYSSYLGSGARNQDRLARSLPAFPSCGPGALTPTSCPRRRPGIRGSTTQLVSCPGAMRQDGLVSSDPMPTALAEPREAGVPSTGVANAATDVDVSAAPQHTGDPAADDSGPTVVLLDPIALRTARRGAGRGRRCGQGRRLPGCGGRGRRRGHRAIRRHPAGLPGLALVRHARDHRPGSPDGQ